MIFRAIQTIFLLILSLSWGESLGSCRSVLSDKHRTERQTADLLVRFSVESPFGVEESQDIAERILSFLPYYRAPQVEIHGLTQASQKARGNQEYSFQNVLGWRAWKKAAEHFSRLEESISKDPRINGTVKFVGGKLRALRGSKPPFTFDHFHDHRDKKNILEIDFTQALLGEGTRFLDFQLGLGEAAVFGHRVEHKPIVSMNTRLVFLATFEFVESH